MKKILFCNVKMNGDAAPTVYESSDSSIPVSDMPVRYPVTAFFEKTLRKNDEIKAVLLAKQDKAGQYKENVQKCMDEFMEMGKRTGASVHADVIYTPFEEEKSVHNKLLMDIVEKLEEEAHIVVDMTFGPKDLSIILFSVMNIAERFFGCEIDNIMYGQRDFVGNEPGKAHICEMAPLYYLNSLAGVIRCDTPEEAKKALRAVLSV